MVNEDAAKLADLVVITVPFSAHIPTLQGLKEALKGKILVDVSVPLVPPKVTKVQMPPAGSAALEARQVLVRMPGSSLLSRIYRMNTC